VAIRTFIRSAVLGLAAVTAVTAAVAGSFAQAAPRLGAPPVAPSQPPVAPSQPPVAPSQPPVAPSQPLCTAGSLSATYTLVFGSNATGHVEYTLTLTNRSGAACVVSEPLALTLLGAHGQALPTDPVFTAGGSDRVVLAAGQWAQAVSDLSPDLSGPGESTRGNCEPVAHGLRITIGTGSVRAPMDATPVCQQGEIAFDRLRAVPMTARCTAGALTAAFRRQEPPFDGFAEYALTLRNRTTRACHTPSVPGLRLLSSHGRRLATTVRAGISSPVVIRPHVVETAVARVATRGGSCDVAATRLAIAPAGGGATLRAAVRPPVAVCRDGLIELSTLFRNG